MTNYNDGNWHAWHGGECPVHPKSMVEGYWRSDEKTVVGSAIYNRGYAYGLNFAWDGETKLKLFRVVKEYREPREWWLVKNGSSFLAYNSARDAKTAYPGCTPIHVKEIIE